MKLFYAQEFKKCFKKLPPMIQRLYRKQEIHFRKNWRDSRLHTKRLVGHASLFSFRVTREYRVLFVLIESDIVLLTTIGHRKDIYR